MSKVTSGDRYSFRWGVEVLDRGFLTIPNCFMDQYASAGVSGHEWLFILHLARFHFESVRGMSGVPLCMIADRMGCKVRSVQRLRASLEKKRFLLVHHRPGRCSEYDFSALSAKLLALADDAIEQKFGGDKSVITTPDKSDMGVVTKVTPHENKEEEQDNNMVVVADRLVCLGVSLEVAETMLQTYGLARVSAVIRSSTTRARNRAGWIVSALRQGWTVDGETEQLEFVVNVPSAPLPVVDVRWSSALLEFEQQVTRATFGRWFSGLQLGEWSSGDDGDRVVVWCRDGYVVEWLRDRMGTMMNRTLASIADRPVELKFIIEGGDPNE